MKAITVFISIILLSGCMYPQQAKKKSSSKISAYRQITLEEMVRRYIAKTQAAGNSIEGIYTVSSEVIKKSKGILSREWRERIVDKKNNYATVAILKDWPGSSTEYVEISLNGDNAVNYPIISEISSLSSEQGFIFNHFDKKGGKMPFTFTSDDNMDVLEGVYTEIAGKSTIIYKLSYLKTYPKNKNFSQRID